MARTTKKRVQDRDAKIKERTENALQTFTDMIRSGNFPAQIGRIAALTVHSDAPAAKWSAGNQLMMIACGTMDARGYRQWQQVGRQVKKGAKALYIMSPRTITRTVENDRGEEEKQTFVVGFGYTPVFRVEDTEGEPLTAYDPPELPPLVGVAEALGVSVAYAPPAGNFLGYYAPTSDEIVLCSHHERVFFHELAHAAHYRLKKNAATPESDTVRKEIVAETTAAALATMYGLDYGKMSRDYIAHVTQTVGNDEATLRQIMKYAGEIRDVLTLILTTEDRIKSEGEAA